MKICSGVLKCIEQWRDKKQNKTKTNEGSLTCQTLKVTGFFFLFSFCLFSLFSGNCDRSGCALCCTVLSLI